MSNHMYILTGGPGSGKTSLIEALGDRGYACLPEAGRAIIRDQQAIGGTALPWADRQAFAELMLGWELRSHSQAAAMAGPVFLDRGIPDVAGYLTLCGLPVPEHTQQAARRCRYNPKVFVAPFWPAIYAQDSERRQEAAEAEQTCRVMEQTYARMGYDLVTLPLDSIEARAEFILAAIRS